MANIPKTEERQLFEHWLSLSPEEREGMPKNKSEFGKKHGLSHPTMKKYEVKYWASRPEEAFDLQEYLSDNLEDMAKALVEMAKSGKNIKGIELALRALGKLVEKREETHKFELTPNDRITIARQLRDHLRREYENTGNCSVCQRPALLRHEVCVGTEPEHAEGGEVATVGLLT